MQQLSKLNPIRSQRNKVRNRRTVPHNVEPQPMVIFEEPTNDLPSESIQRLAKNINLIKDDRSETIGEGEEVDVDEKSPFERQLTVNKTNTIPSCYDGQEMFDQRNEYDNNGSIFDNVENGENFDTGGLIPKYSYGKDTRNSLYRLRDQYLRSTQYNTTQSKTFKQTGKAKTRNNNLKTPGTASKPEIGYLGDNVVTEQKNEDMLFQTMNTPHVETIHFDLSGKDICSNITANKPRYEEPSPSRTQKLKTGSQKQKVAPVADTQNSRTSSSVGAKVKSLAQEKFDQDFSDDSGEGNSYYELTKTSIKRMKLEYEKQINQYKDKHRILQVTITDLRNQLHNVKEPPILNVPKIDVYTQVEIEKADASCSIDLVVRDSKISQELEESHARSMKSQLLLSGTESEKTKNLLNKLKLLEEENVKLKIENKVLKRKLEQKGNSCFSNNL